MAERIFLDDFFFVADFDAFLNVSPCELKASRIDDLAKPVFSSISRKEHPAS